ncbi:MAG: hypothetical protein H5U32_02360 [Pseudomonas balearica]|uniref:hypothetical protein n=1 Tax=Stutzerimonas balearica TaxID=74829 RepID=UPI001991E492|nr:hypothetical protein [Stutzerimonas balearica]MBC7198070.1 hypothetical protein [Stutzerimonas balearica]
MPEKYAKIVHQLAHHQSSIFPGAWWLSNRYRVVDVEGRDLLDPAEWPAFKKVARRRAESLGYKLVGDELQRETRKVVYRRAADFDQALSIKRACWKEGNECFVHKHEDGSFSTWEVWS